MFLVKIILPFVFIILLAVVKLNAIFNMNIHTYRHKNDVTGTLNKKDFVKVAYIYS